MITVHHLDNSRSQRILWLLEELDLPYEIRFYKRNAKTMLAPPELRAIHPLGKAPVVTDGDVVLAESGAIIDELIERHGAGRLRPPAGTADRRRYNYWLHYAEGSLMPPLLVRLIFDKVKTAPVPFFIKPVTGGIAKMVDSTYTDPQIHLHLSFLESELGRSQWFAGEELTAADIQMSFPVEAAIARGGSGKTWPRLHNYIDRIHARPAYQRALQKGGPVKILS